MEPLRFYSVVNNLKPASYVLAICGEKLVVLHKEANHNQKGPDSGDRQTELDCQLAASFALFFGLVASSELWFSLLVVVILRVENI